MTHSILIDELAKRLKTILHGIDLPSETIKRTPIQIFKQHLPKDLFETTAYYPLVLVEWFSTADNVYESSEATVGLTIGTYSEKNDWYKDAFHIMDSIRYNLLVERVIGGRYRIRQMTWETPNNQPEPFYFITCEAKYGIYLPQEKGTW